MNKPEKIRKKHFKNFMKLAPEEQLHWALSQGHFWKSLIPEKEKKIIEHFRHGRKRITSS